MSTGIGQIRSARHAARLFGSLFILTSLTTTAQAQAFWESWSWRTSGLLRTELAIKTNSTENRFNAFGNEFNRTPVTIRPGNPFTGFSDVASSDDIEQGFLDTADLPIDLSAIPVVDGTLPLEREALRSTPSPSSTFNYAITRLEPSLEVQFTRALRLRVRARLLYDFGSQLYENFDPRDFPEPLPGGADPQLSRSSPNYQSYRVEARSGRMEGGWRNNPFLFEWSGSDYFIDFPALFLEYNQGPFQIRAGNMQIAWGQALFFRTMDIANGLDTRRHLIIGRGLEEFADERVPAPAVRVGYQLSRVWEVDAFAQQFRPTIFPNPNTPFNLITHEFTVHDQYLRGGYDKKVNYGIRLQGQWGQWGVQFMAAHRHNPNGAFRWTASQVNRALPNSNVLGASFNQYCEAVLGSPVGEGCGPQLAQVPLDFGPLGSAMDAAGVQSAHQWFTGAQNARLGGIDALNVLIEEFPVAQDLFAQTVDNKEDAIRQIDAFAYAGESIRGHIDREYHSENIFGVGASYVLQLAPTNFFNQTIFNLEVSYAPDRVFTDTGLRQSFLTDDDWSISFVAENWHRFTPAFPGTYMVFQYKFRPTSDLFGRHLSGMGSEGSPAGGPTVVAPDDPGTGSGNAQYIVLAAEQPFPGRVWETAFAMLIDVRGGIFIQPGIRWNPGRNLQFDLFYNFLEGSAWGTRSENIISTFDFAEEAVIRATWQF